MDKTVVQYVLVAAVALVVGAFAGWIARRLVAQHSLRRKQRFFGLPQGSECLLVINQDAAVGEQNTYVARHDVFALLELAALITECGAHPELVGHDVTQPGFGGRTEFCIGGPVWNRRMAAHIASLLPGVGVDTSKDPGPQRGAFTIGKDSYAMRRGEVEYVLLARVTAGSTARPVFLASGQRAVTNQAAVHYLTDNWRSLARKHGVNGMFCLLLKVVNSHAYGPDVVELVSDVSKQARTAS